MSGGAAGAICRRRVPGATALVLVLGSLGGLGGGGAAHAAEVEVSATLEPRDLAAGDVAVLTLEARGGVFGGVRFRPRFQLENFAVVDGPRRSDGVSVVDGTTARTFRLTWRLRALAPGLAAVREIDLAFGREHATLPDARAMVRDAPGSYGGFGPREDAFGVEDEPVEARRVFLHAEATAEKPWTGQQLLYSLWIYTQVEVTATSLAEAPQFPGFWVETVPVQEDGPEGGREGEGEAVEIEGELYLRKLLLRRALFPLRPGRLEIPPVDVDLLVSAPRRRDFGPLVTDSRRISRRSEPVTVEARPLPPAPPGFAGLVGNLALHTRLAPAEVTVGQAATLEVELTGGGQLQGAPEPAVTVPEGLKILAPEEEGERGLAGTTVEGTRRWRFPVVAEAAGVFRLPPVEVPYFDPEAGEYRVAAGEALLVRARAADAAGGGDAVAAGPGPAPHPIRSAAFPAAEAPAWRRYLPGVFALPWAVVLAVSLARARRLRAARGRARRGHDAGGEDPERRFADHLAAAGGEEVPRRAAAGIEGAWRDLLAARRGIDPATPVSQWTARLLAGGSDAAAVAALGALVDDLHYLRFAPQLSTVADLRGELVERSLALAPRLAAAGGS